MSPEALGRPARALRVRLSGRVQGVGFRPFVYRLAHRHGLRGRVRNLLGEVEIVAEGDDAALDDFLRALVAEAPPLAQPVVDASTELAAFGYGEFSIEASEVVDEARIRLPPDYFTCDDCVGELRDPEDRRHGYPFINCTQCGPRYTLIAALPYDRPNTSMAGFKLSAHRFG